MGIRSTFDRMIAARERQARCYVNGILLSMDDETLARAGFTREQLNKERSSTTFVF